MHLLGRIRGARTARQTPASPSASVDPIEQSAEACPRCGERFERLLDPAGRWFVCTRCGARTDHEDHG